MRKFIIPLLIAVISAVSSCETYEKVPQNDAFRIGAAVSSASAADGVAIDISVLEGTYEGDSRLAVLLRNTADGSSPSFSVLLAGNSTIRETDTWSFDDKGKVSVVLAGVPAGDYQARIQVTRWYHTATAVIPVTVNP